MSKIEIYSTDYDSNQDVLNGGMSSKVFVSTPQTQYECKTISEAFNSLDFDNITEIDLYYQKSGKQYFKKLTVAK